MVAVVSSDAVTVNEPVDPNENVEVVSVPFTRPESTGVVALPSVVEMWTVSELFTMCHVASHMLTVTGVVMLPDKLCAVGEPV